jgi:hypothetical protein
VIKFIKIFLVLTLFFSGLYFMSKSLLSSPELQSLEDQNNQVAAIEPKETKIFIPNSQVTEIIPINHQDDNTEEIAFNPKPSIPVIKNPINTSYKVWIENKDVNNSSPSTETTIDTYTFTPKETSEACLEKSTDAKLLEFVNQERTSEGLEAVKFVCLN